MLSTTPFELLDRAIHMYGLDFKQDDLRSIWREREIGWTASTLDVDVWVPLALLPAEVDEFAIARGLVLRKIPDGLQRARVPHSIFGGAVHECVLEAATHALVLEGQTRPNRNVFTPVTGADRPQWQPEQIVRCVAALRLVVGQAVGWAQAFYVARGWSDHYTADLPVVHSAGLARNYPPSFENYGWIRAPRPLTQERRSIAGMAFRDLTLEQLTRAAALYAQMEQATDKVALAIRRHDSAVLRDREDDAVVDLLIALEAGLGEGAAEMTHKLSLRVAAVMNEPGRTRSQAFQLMKALYRYRSTIVHGGNASAKRVAVVGGQRFVLLDVAFRFTRAVLAELLVNPQLQDPKEIDVRLLLGGSSGAADDARDQA